MLVAKGNLDQWRTLCHVKSAQANDETLAVPLNWVQNGQKSSAFELLERPCLTCNEVQHNAQLDMLCIDSD